MENINTLNILKQCFKISVPERDGRVNIPHLEFVTGLIFCFLGDTKSFGLEAIRRFFIATFEIRISKGAFWERLSRPRLNKMLKGLVEQLMKQIPCMALIGEELLMKLGVNAINMIDSSSITLWDGAKGSFPGTRTTSGVKWHVCFDLLSSRIKWYETTSTSVNDRKCFPEVCSLAGALTIFDLGYWDYGLLFLIDKAKGYFLSRVKSNAAIVIREIIKGASCRQIGKKLRKIKIKRGEPLIELIGEVVHDKEIRLFRIIGFWNTAEKCYHYYITNLKAPACVIYTLYRVRWQLELIFKSCKRSFNLDNRLTSNNENIIESLLISNIAASFASHVVLEIGLTNLSEEQKLAISFQRLAHVVVLTTNEFIEFLVCSSIIYASKLINKIKLLSSEIYEKNHQKRLTTLKRLQVELNYV